MKRVFFCFCMVLISLISYCQSTSITVTIKDIRDTKGSLLVGVYTNKNDFLKKPVLGKSVKVTDHEIKVVFDNLPPGEYAVSIIHDENDNKELDRNKLGLPKEGYCFGNNVLGKIGPPSYERVKIVLKSEPVRQTLNMKYHL